MLFDAPGWREALCDGAHIDNLRRAPPRPLHRRVHHRVALAQKQYCGFETLEEG
jgi:hypothetical protein